MSDILSIPITFWGNNKELPDPELLLLYKELERREIWLTDEVCYENVGLIIKYINYLNATESDNLTPIKFYIFSQGGDLSIMFTLYHVIKTSKIPIHTINTGIAHSAAFLIFLSGHERSMYPYSTFIAHEGSIMTGGSYRETKNAQKQYDKDIAIIKRIIAERTNFTLEELEEKFEREQDLYIDYTMAKEKGVITKELD